MPDDGLWFRPKYCITSNITSIIQLPNSLADQTVKHLLLTNNSMLCNFLFNINIRQRYVDRNLFKSLNKLFNLHIIQNQQNN